MNCGMEGSDYSWPKQILLVLQKREEELRREQAQRREEAERAEEERKRLKAQQEQEEREKRIIKPPPGTIKILHGTRGRIEIHNNVVSASPDVAERIRVEYIDGEPLWHL